MLLPIRDASLTAVLDYGYIFGMRNGQSFYDNYLYRHYCSVCYIDDANGDIWDSFDFYPAPRIKQITKAGVLNATGYSLCASPCIDERSFPQLIRNLIRSGKYCYGVLDHFYLRGTVYYGLKHYPHHGLIVGYNDKTNDVAVVGHFQQRYHDLRLGWQDAVKNLYYGIRWIPQKEFTRSVYFDPDVVVDHDLQQLTISSHKYIEALSVAGNAGEEFSIELFASAIAAHLESRPQANGSTEHHRDLSCLQVSYGLRTYSEWERLVSGVCKKTYRKFAHIRIRVFWEHKQFLLERALHAQRVLAAPISATTIGKLRSLIREARRFRFTYVQCSANGAVPSYRDWVASLLACRELEVDACESLLEDLSLC